MGILAGGFLGVILLGGVLLWMPFSNRQPIEFMDALFTSVSAVCVTGLVTITPAFQFTLAGQMILLVLIQIGGLGVIACVTAFFLLLRRKITLKERIVIQETYNMDKLSGMVLLVRGVLFGTFAVEGVGAALYAIQFIPEYGVVKGIWYSIFHAVSAFCNAGIDILGDSSLTAYVTNPIVNLTTMILIILSGLGFTVWFDIIANGKKLIRREMPRRWWFTRLKLQSKLAIIMTILLIISGGSIRFSGRI